MKESHRLIQEELALWALGIAPDVPVAALADHLARCPECRRYLGEVHETAGDLAAAAGARRPPASLKGRILERVAAEPHGAAAEELQALDGRMAPTSWPLTREEGGDGETAGGAAQERASDGAPLRELARPGQGGAEAGRGGAPWLRAMRHWLGTAAAVAAVVFGLNAVQLSGRVTSLQREVESWAARYDADFRWLRSAEYLLAHEIGPKGTAGLLPLEESGGPGAAGPGSPRGKAVLYDAYQGRMYLLVSLDGLEAGASYEIWEAGGVEPEMLGSVTAGEQGAAVFVHPTTGDRVPAALEVRRQGRPVLAGELAPAAPAGGAW